jgi:hypothetical protein
MKTKEEQAELIVEKILNEVVFQLKGKGVEIHIPFKRIPLLDILAESLHEETTLKENTTEFLQQMQILKLEPGDVLILRHPNHLKTETMLAIKEAVYDALGRPPQNRVVFFEEGMEVGILRPSADPDKG